MSCHLDRPLLPTCLEVWLRCRRLQSSDSQVDLISATFAPRAPLVALCQATFAVLASEVARPRRLLLPQTLKNVCFP